MGFFNKYPYTDFHEMNLDWFLLQFKHLVDDWDTFHKTISKEWNDYQESLNDEWNRYQASLNAEWTETKNAWNVLYTFVHDYFDNLDVQREIDNKMDRMIEDGTFLAIMTSYLPYVEPEMFGAVSGQDSTEAFKNMLSAHKHIIMRGTYIINDSIEFREGTTIEGGGIKITSSGNAIVLNNHVTIKNVSFEDGLSSLLSAVHFIRADEKTDINIIDCNFKSIHYENVIDLVHCSNIVIINNTINTYNYSGVHCSNGCRNMDISNNYIYNGIGTQYGRRYPITFSAYGSDSSMGAADNVRVCHNYIEDITPLWEAIDSHGSTNVLISHNVIKNTGKGIAIVIPASADAITSSNVEISFNDITIGQTSTSVTQFGVLMEGYNSENVSVTNNHITNMYGTVAALSGGIIMRSVDGSTFSFKQLNVSHNFINTIGNGVYVANKVYNVDISYNDINGTVDGSQYGVNLASITEYSVVAVTNNIFGNTLPVNRAIRGCLNTTVAINNEFVKVDDNQFINVTLQYNDVNFLNNPKSQNGVNNVLVGHVGDILIPNTENSSILFWVANTNANMSTSTKCVWSPVNRA